MSKKSKQRQPANRWTIPVSVRLPRPLHEFLEERGKRPGITLRTRSVGQVLVEMGLAEMRAAVDGKNGDEESLAMDARCMPIRLKIPRS